LARAHAENFPVASRLLPPAMRPHIAAIYAFARMADDMADEGTRPDAERLAMLDDWERRLRAAAEDTATPAGTTGAGGVAVFPGLCRSIRSCALGVEPLGGLVSAFRQDVPMHRHDSWGNGLHFCRRSANPVGRLVLAVAGYRDSRLGQLSDAV